MDQTESGGDRSRTLLEALAEVPDPRRRRGQRYRLAALLGLAVCAMLCGARSQSAIAQWGRDHGAQALRLLGFTGHQMPCGATFHLLFKVLDRAAFETVLMGWFLEQAGGSGAISVDGKRLRGSAQDPVPGVHLVAAFSQEFGLVLGQEDTGETGGEVGALRRLLQALPITGAVLTGDAQFTQRDLAETIVEKGGTTSSSSRTISRRYGRTSPPSGTTSPCRRPRPRNGERAMGGWNGGGCGSPTRWWAIRPGPIWPRPAGSNAGVCWPTGTWSRRCPTRSPASRPGRRLPAGSWPCGVATGASRTGCSGCGT